MIFLRAPRSALRTSLIPHFFFVVFVLLFVVAPLACYFAGFLRHPGDTLARVLASPAEAARVGGLLGRSLGIAALAATLALAAAVAIFCTALALPPRAARVLLAAAALPFFIPATVAAIAWIQAFGQAGWLTHALAVAGLPETVLPSILYSTPGCALALALHDYPIILALAWLGWRGAGRAALEAGATLMPPARLWRGLLLGWLRPWLAAGWLLVFMRALHEYSIPLLLRRHVFSVEIVSAFNIDYNPARALALALPLVAAGLLGALILARLLGRVRWPADPGAAPRLPRPGRGTQAALIGMSVIVLLPALGVPLITLSVMAGGWQAFQTVAISARDQITFSLTVAALAALAAVILGLRMNGSAECGARSAENKFQKNHFLSALRAPHSALLLLLGLPGSVVAMAQIAFWNRTGWGGLPGRFYDSGLALPLGLAILILPVAWVILRARLRETPSVLIETQRLQPLAPWRGWWLLTAPRLARPALVAAGLGFVLSLHEAQASLLLAAPGQETLSIRAMTLLHNAPDALVAALCLILVALIAAGLSALWATGRLAGMMSRRWN